jgi:hypothetical protein
MNEREPQADDFISGDFIPDEIQDRVKKPRCTDDWGDDDTADDDGDDGRELDFND